MRNYEAELDFETKHLLQTVALAQEQLAALRQASDRQEADIIATKKDQWENASHAVSNLWGSDSFYELAALSQYENQVANKVSAWELAAQKQRSLERMVQNPYFARIDFRFAGEQQAAQVYIGRASLLDEHKMIFHVYDWRSPLASVFYRFGVGEAWYEAPRGKISGQVELKRQYEISRGALEYFFDADVQIMDEFLKKLLAQNASPQMKSIVETIQKDQDIIIRDMEHDVLLVQGVAGSGKTSVALHRVAYLMYQGLANKLAAHNIMIISPNTLFERYIAKVLPELGEDNVVTVTFDSMIADILANKQVQSRNQLLESLLLAGADSAESRLRRQALEFKTSAQFTQVLERFIEDIPRTWLEFSDVAYDGQIIAGQALLQKKALETGEPLQVRLKLLEASIWEKVHEQRPARLEKLRDFVAQQEGTAFEIEEQARLLSIEESTALKEEIQRFTRLDIFGLYQKLFGDWAYFQRLAQGLELPGNMEQIVQFTQENLQEQQLAYEDGLALAFLRLRLSGLRQSRQIKQVVIDEAQDYYELHFQLLRLLFPNARYTVLGDIWQTIEKPADAGWFTGIAKILGKEKYAVASMNKSFRCTREILNFSQKFLPPGSESQSFNRQGAKPQICAARDRQELDQLLLREIQLCRQAGYQSIGLLCKTEQDAASLHVRLKEQIEVQLITSASVTDIRGTFIAPIYMAKGLEFDAVLLCDTDKEHYAAGDDEKLLYIGCTRALHRLNLFYAGAISPLLCEKEVL